MKVLVVGSYPPVPGAAAEATFAAVKQLWAQGHEVEVASPRPSAAHHRAWPFVDLEDLLHRSGAERLILCIEPGWPLPRNLVRLRSLRRACRGAQFIVVGNPWSARLLGAKDAERVHAGTTQVKPVEPISLRQVAGRGRRALRRLASRARGS
ncbi:MAG TPA: hypothetical protein VFN61_01505 [Acidimicrobiales bacterium]|nr:hypothetical protein [Acidimicrobiales bacterium]